MPDVDVACGDLVLSEQQFCGFLNLRVRVDGRGVASACKRALGVALPTEANTWVGGDALAVCWLGPDEWLVVTAPGAASGTGERLAEALDGTWHSLVDQSSAHTIVRLAGAAAVDALAKGCTLDFRGEQMGQGRAAQTLVAKTGALVIVREPERVIDLCVRRSFADYLWLWLADAGAEYGVVTARGTGFGMAP